MLSLLPGIRILQSRIFSVLAAAFGALTSVKTLSEDGGHVVNWPASCRCAAAAARLSPEQHARTNTTCGRLLRAKDVRYRKISDDNVMYIVTGKTTIPQHRDSYSDVNIVALILSQNSMKYKPETSIRQDRRIWCDIAGPPSWHLPGRRRKYNIMNRLLLR